MSSNVLTQSGIPKYLRVKRELIRLIVDGVFPIGSQIYTTDELAERFGVARGTVRKAIEELVAEGFLEAKQGRGTFVRARTIDRSGDGGPEPRILEICFLDQRAHIHNPHNFNLLRGALAVASERGYKLRVALLPTQQPIEMRTFLTERRLQGAAGVLFAHGFPEPLSSASDPDSLPFVLMNCGRPEPDLYTVDAPTASAIPRAIRHLAQLGRHRIAMLACEPRDMPQYGVFKDATELYIAAFWSELRALELAAAGTIAHAEPEIISGRAAALQLLSRQPRPDAVLAAADLLAIGVYEAAFELGLRIPEDLAVIGAGQLEVGIYLDPPLTTIRAPDYEVGVRGAGLLIDLIEGRRPHTRHIAIRCDLAIRQSCGFERRDEDAATSAGYPGSSAAIGAH